jgi:DNA-binding XRE family transcriptional regulator
MERRGATPRPVAAGLPGLAAVGPAASFGGLLRACRERALLSQEQLAERAGLSARTIRELEAGRVRRPRGATVRLLAQALALRGSLRQAFVAAARSGDAVPRGGREGGGLSWTGGGGVLAPPPSEGAGLEHPTILVFRLGVGPTAPSSALSLPDAMPYRAVGPRLDRRAASLEGSKVVVVAVVAELRVGCCGQCRTGGRQQTG